MRSISSSSSGLPLRVWCAHYGVGEHVLPVRVGKRAATLSPAVGDCRVRLDAGWAGLLAFTSRLRVDSDVWVLPGAGVNVFKLQAFVDQAIDPDEGAKRPALSALSALRVPEALLDDGHAFEHWYLSRILTGSERCQAFVNWLRHSESYQLIRFLLQEGATGEKLSGLAQRYGVSVSHFRRLCHQALGGAAKPELREWRTAKALLALSPGRSSLTEIAMSYGFASSSHFSKEIRELVGVAPSRLTDITRLSSR